MSGFANARASIVDTLAEAPQNSLLKAVELQWQWQVYHLIK